MRKPSRKTVRDSIRASVPKGKLRAAKIVLADNPEKNSPIGGFTEYDRETSGGHVVKIGAPAGDNAHGITIRGHETRHATRHTPKRKKPMTENEAMASQIVDDVNIECTPLPNTDSVRPYRRAHLAVAMSGVRTLQRNARAVRDKLAADNAALRNGQLLNAVRTTAMLHSYAQGDIPMVKRGRTGTAMFAKRLETVLLRRLLRSLNWPKASAQGQGPFRCWSP